GSISIGRAPKNDWVLQDPERILSSEHCVVHYKGGGYVLTDKSLNGTFLNDSEQRIPREHTVPLRNSDRFVLGEYEIEATIVSAEEEDEALEAEGPVTDIVLSPGLAPADINIPEKKTPSPLDASLDIVKPPFNDLLAESRDSLGLEHPAPELRAPGGVATEPPLDIGGPEGAAYEPPDLLSPEPSPPAESPEPAVETPVSPLLPPRQEVPEEPPRPEPVTPAEPEALVIPDDWWKTPPVSSPAQALSLAVPSAEPVAPRPMPVVEPVTLAPPAVEPATGLDASTLLRAFLDGAGLPQMRLNEDQLPEIMANLGAMFRETVRGLMDILLARGDLKGEFRLDRTAIGPLENNPLKTPPGQSPLRVEEVMALLLLISQKGAYMSPVQAVHEGFHDIKAHQLAVMAGIQAALARLLDRFDPSNLEARLEQSVLDNIWPANRKAKYWDLFNAEYQAIAREAEDDFNELFGDEFARAYEERLRSG
ncbi:MAG: type VI secretion system-associated FHA domain protein TagH, partial [Candidatus Competibacteraceae bacterium]|nr:type VI secretion system-associated FHA domain protein TagH [Candidatus Competibacteraceae bacterium]